MPRVRRGATVQERLAAKTDRSGGTEACWPWLGAKGGIGYGALMIGSTKKYVAHRLAYEDAFGPIPDGQFVLHRCDNPPCCNPAHLFVGTPADNMIDKMRKGRCRNQHSTPAKD